MATDASRFVYLYTTANNKVPVYVGRGTASRIDGHGVDDANPQLAKIIASGDYAIEVLDCGDPKSAELVEGALISAMHGRSQVKLCNGRLDKYVFEPLGVPQSLGHRRSEPGLTPTEIASHVGGPVLLVRIGSKKLRDPERAVIAPGHPSDESIADRMRRYWKIRSWIPQWIEHSELAPRALIGIAGEEHRYVIGSIDLKNFDWSTVDGRADVELSISPRGDQLDAYALRGRTVLEGKIFKRGENVRLYNSDGRIELR